VSEKRKRLEAELAKIRQAIAAQEALQGTLPAEQLEAMLAPLRHKEADLQAQLSGVGSIAQGEGTVAVTATQGSTAIGAVRGNVYFGPQPRDEAEALAIYRQVLFQTSGHLSLRGVDLEASNPAAPQKALGLVNVYIDLNTTTQIPLSEAEKKSQQEGRGPARQPETRPLSALEAIVANRRMVLLGDPGGGKSMLVNHLAHCLAGHALEPDQDWLAHLLGWPQAEARQLPVVVILRDFARSLPDPLPDRAEPAHLWDFITARLKAQRLDFVAGPLARLLEEGRALLLLDGLDEVPSLGQREFVRDAVAAFMARYQHNRYLVTCRTLSYQPPAAPDDPDLRLSPQEPDFELAPFDAARIDRFISAWYAELARLGSVRGEDQAGLTRQLKEAVRRPDLWRLAPNPLLLTVMALVHTHKGRLPDARALLYEETIDILLWRWEQLKLVGGQTVPPLRQLLVQAKRTDGDLKQVLARLAYEAHAQGGEPEQPEQLADIGELGLQHALAQLKGGDRNWAYQVIETIKLRAGLLLERAPSIFTFPHRTFQEYLAGAHLASLPDFPRQASDLVEAGSLWREVILLAVGRLVYRLEDTNKPLGLVVELCPEGAARDEGAWRKAWLAGEVLLEMGLNRVRDQALGRELLPRVRERLAALLAGGHLAPRERADAGEVLARLGDRRPGVGLLTAKTEPALSLPDLAFCYIPPGPFWLGSEEYDNEKPPHQVDIPYGYWLGRYPVTVAQFRAFVRASGYQPATSRSLEGPANQSVVRVTWHDALAFGRWLTEIWRAGAAGLAAKPLPENLIVTLPSEAEWEKGARGGLRIPRTRVMMSLGRGLKSLTSEGEGPPPQKLRLEPNQRPQRAYPWGDRPDPDRANYDQTRLGRPSPAGSFPGGASPYGCLDMAGNVWEWTRSLWGQDWQKPDFKYPYDPQDGREDLQAGDEALRVLRGGSFGDVRDLVRCAARGRSDPGSRGYDVGFRVVVSPLPLGSEPSGL
jgi:formylglycine-generating enzyme required for sulfatase activity